MKTLTLYRNALSGHSHRVELFLSLLGIEATLVEVDLAKQDHRQPEFLQKNSLGQVPVLEDGKFTIADSNAILVYLATKYDPMRQWLPAAASTSALIQCFLCKRSVIPTLQTYIPWQQSCNVLNVIRLR